MTETAPSPAASPPIHWPLAPLLAVQAASVNSPR